MIVEPLSTDQRRTRYEMLVAQRKECRECVGITNPSECEGGRYDSDHIGPWSVWQGNLSTALMVVGQDWGDEHYFVANAGRDSPKNPTNETLRELLRGIGIEVPGPGSCNGEAGLLFFTNALLCLKTGGMQANVDSQWLANCGSRFLKPTIEIVRPKVVVALGQRAYRAITDVYQIHRLAFRNAVGDAHGFDLGNGIKLFPVYHCGRRILNTHRNIDPQHEDWQRIRAALDRNARKGF